MNKALEVLRVIFPTNDQTAEVAQPRKEAFHFPSALESSEAAAILRFSVGAAPVSVRRNHLGTKAFHQFSVQAIAVVRFVSDESLRHLGDQPCFQSGRYEGVFSRASTFCPSGDRKTMAVCNGHELGAFAALGLAHAAPPFLAGTNVPSTKHSVRSRPPRSRRSLAKANRTRSKTPERTQFWKRRCTVWYFPYRSGKSFQGAPVRKIQRMPLKTWRRSVQGRPRPSARTGSAGRSESIKVHCSFVRSIHRLVLLKR